MKNMEMNNWCKIKITTSHFLGKKKIVSRSFGESEMKIFFIDKLIWYSKVSPCENWISAKRYIFQIKNNLQFNQFAQGRKTNIFKSTAKLFPINYKFPMNDPKLNGFQVSIFHVRYPHKKMNTKKLFCCKKI